MRLGSRFGRAVAAVVATMGLLPKLGFGQEICSCAPAEYNFRIDFSGTCPTPNTPFSNNTGVDRFFCRTGAGTPVALSSFSIRELDSSMQVIKQTFRDGLSLLQGDMFMFTSIAAGDITVPDQIPAALQASMTALDAEGVEITSQWILTYTNLCDQVVFENGDTMAFTVFDDLVPARSELCSIATAPNTTPPEEKATVEPNPPPAEPSMSVPLRRLNWLDWTEDVGPDFFKEDRHGGLDKKLRKRRTRIKQNL